MEMADENRRLDGNAVAGLLGEIFRFEMTTARDTCAGCGEQGYLGQAMVYAHGMGTIVRCAGCDNPLIRVTSIRGEYRVDTRGLRVLRVGWAT